jgi:hypothetical protein
MIDNHSIALDNAVNSEVAAVTGIGDLPILKHPYGDFYSVNSRSAVPHDLHSRSRSTSNASANAHHLLKGSSVLVACLKMNMFVLYAVKSCACMHEYACNLVAFSATLAAEHRAGLENCVRVVKVVLSALGLCHSDSCSGELTAE